MIMGDERVFQTYVCIFRDCIMSVFLAVFFCHFRAGRVSCPDLEEPFISLFWLGQGVTRVGSLVFLFLCWPGIVPNQRQLSIVVSDWGSHLGSL